MNTNQQICFWNQVCPSPWWHGSSSMKTSCRRWPQDCARLPIPPSKPWGVFWSAPRWQRTWSWDRFRFPSECCLSSLSLALMLCRRYEKQKKSLLKNVEEKREKERKQIFTCILSYTVVCLSLRLSPVSCVVSCFCYRLHACHHSGFAVVNGYLYCACSSGSVGVTGYLHCVCLHQW